MLRRRQTFRPRVKAVVKRIVTCRSLDGFQCADCSSDEWFFARAPWKWGRKEGVKEEFRCRGCNRFIRLAEFEPMTFDSLLEYSVYDWLWTCQKMGEIWDLQAQVEVPLPFLNKSGMWRADFVFHDALHTDEFVCVDAKGFPRQRDQILARIWRVHGPGVLRIAKQGRNRAINWLPDIQGESLPRRVE